MNITYTWDCTTVDTYPAVGELSDVIFNVHWRLTGVDEDTEMASTSIGTQMIDVDDLTDFVEFADLTNDLIAEWVETAIGAEGVELIKSSIANAIEEKINPTVVTKTIGQ